MGAEFESSWLEEEASSMRRKESRKSYKGNEMRRMVVGKWMTSSGGKVRLMAITETLLSSSVALVQVPICLWFLVIEMVVRCNSGQSTQKRGNGCHSQVP